MNLIPGNVYVAVTGNIFKWGGRNSSKGCADASHYFGTQGNTPNSYFGKNGGGFGAMGDRDATETEKRWLEACIKADRWMPIEEAIGLVQNNADNYELTF